MAAPCLCTHCRNARAAPSPAPPAAAPRSHFTAHAEQFAITPCSDGTALPLQRHSSQGRYACHGGAVIIPDDGYYMLLWELTIDHVTPSAQLRLGINDSGSVLTNELAPGHDSGQQVTWLNRGDRVSLQALSDELGELHGQNAQLTIIRLG
ncbi:MAG: hypothetical protein FWB76_07160 [Oscillospiraceae bacterium]|nr:hypothetical protein [Oscillospiraceae bacterium]